MKLFDSGEMIQKTRNELRNAGRLGEELGGDAVVFENFALSFSLPVIIARVLGMDSLEILRNIHAGAEEAKAIKHEKLF